LYPPEFFRGAQLMLEIRSLPRFAINPHLGIAAKRSP
jgi:hypothetical protein